MAIDPDYYLIGFRRAEVFQLLRQHGLDLESRVAKQPSEPTVPERHIPDWAKACAGVRRFTLCEAAAAIAGIPPMGETGAIPDEVWPIFGPIQTGLKQAADDGYLLPTGMEMDGRGHGLEKSLAFDAQDLKQWAEAHGYWWPIPLPPALDPAIGATPAPVPSKATVPTMAPVPSPAPDVAPPTPDIDPADLPEELDAANMAFRAVFNGYGNPADTFRNRLIEYLNVNFPALGIPAIERIATVANPDKARGRPVKFKE